MGKTVCFTGHRDIPRQDKKQLPRELERIIRSLIEEGADCFRAGGACGFDTVAALKVLDLKREYPGIRLELILPCRDQTSRWSAFDKMIYNRILRQADSVEYVTDRYTPYCMLARNRALVKGSDVCVAYLRRDSGGTAYTVQYAQNAGVKVIVIRRFDRAGGLDKSAPV